MATNQVTTFKELTTTERNLFTPDTNTLVFDIDLLQWFVWDGAAWVSISSSISIGSYDGQSPVAAGLQVVANKLYAQSADATHPGMVNTTTQTFAGAKTFSGALAGSSTLDITGTATFHAGGSFTGSLSASNLSGTNTGDVTLGTADGLSLSGQALSLQAADATHTGALTSTDWSTFNGKQAAGNYITALTGDVTASGPGSVGATLAATSNATLTTLSALTTAGSLVSVGTITSGTWSATAIGATKGGTDQTAWTTGDLLYASNTNTLSRLSIGNAGQVLTVASGLPSWGSNVGNLSVVSKTANYNISTADDVILCSPGTPFTVTLPTAVGNSGKTFYIKKTDASANAVTIATTSSQTIDGVTTKALSLQFEEMTVISDNSNWQVIDETNTNNITLLPSLTTVGTLTTGMWNGTAVDATHGGTNQTSWTTGDLLYASGTNTLSKLAKGSANQNLSILGSQSVPSWNTVNQYPYPNYIAGNPNAEVDTGSWAGFNNGATVTISNASPGVLTSNAHGLQNGNAIKLSTGGSLPSPLDTSTQYFVVGATTNTFNVASSYGGTAINTTTNGSGTHTFHPFLPTTGTGGALSTFTFSRSTSSPLRGVGSFSLVTSGSASILGEGVSYDFTIDSADQASVLAVMFNYNATANFQASNGQGLSVTVPGGASDSDLEVFIYDVTNAAMIPVNPRVLTANGANNYIFKGSFQTAPNSTSYRLIIGAATNSAASWTFKFDNVFVGAVPVLYGPPVTDMVTYTPTGSWAANTTYTGWWSRRGDSLRAVIKLAVTGTPTSASLTVNLPSGLTIDTTKLPATPTNQVIGIVTGQGAAHAFSGLVTYSSTTAVAVNYTLDGNTASIMSYAAVTQAAPYTFATGDFIYIYLNDIPISGWSSTTLMSNETDTRVVAASIGLTSNVTPSVNTVIKYDTVIFDTHAAYSTSTGLYTVPVSGKYRVSATMSAAGGTSNIYVTVNGSSKVYLTGGAAGAVVGGSQTVNCSAGDTIGIFNDTSRTFTGAALFVNALSIERLTGPSAIAATDSVNMRYFSSVTSVSSSLANITYATKDFDSHNAYASGTYTIPVSGKYQVNASLLMTAGTTAANNLIQLQINKNGSAYSGPNDEYFTSSSSKPSSLTISDVVNCVAGDTITIQASNAGSTPSISASNSANFISICRVGN